MVRRMVVAAALSFSVAAMTVTGCSSEDEPADGPRMQICGQWIGDADVHGEAGPWYVDASGGNRPPSVVASVGASPTWVKVSSDCKVGTQASVSDPSVIAVTATVQAADGEDVAVLLSPVGTGQAVLAVAGQPVMTFSVHLWTTPAAAPGDSPSGG